MNRRKTLFIIYVLMWMCCTLCILAGIVHWVGTDGDLYYKLQTRAGLPEGAGISAEDMRKLDAHLAGCLSGEEAWNEDAGGEVLKATVDGVAQPAFNEREIRHMEDCQHLFARLRGAAWILAIAFFLLLGLSVRLRRRAKRKPALSRCMWTGSLILCVPLAAFAIWAAIDFSAAFGFFHRRLFTNDLWLLDPATDLLIRICPSDMFASMGLRIALCAAAWMLGVPAITSVLSHFRNS